jgi:ribose transport system permease protein
MSVSTPTGARLAPVRTWLAAKPWIWSFAAALITWLVIGAITGRGLVGTLTATLDLAPFLVLVGIGQMVVITLGNGNIDLSLPNVLTVSAFVSAGVIHGQDGLIWLGILASLAIALVVAALNAGTILLLRVPPIVATLSVGLIIQSFTLIASANLPTNLSTGLVAFTRFRIAGISVLSVLMVLVAFGAGFVLYRTSFGRSVQAIGQKEDAARLSGLRVRTITFSAYLVSALCAAIAGLLLSAYSSPNLDLGQPFLLNSITVVVLGGSLIAGGRSNVVGIWSSSLFLLLLLTLLDVSGANVAVQNIVKGVLIILVLVLVGARRNE